MKIGSEIKFRIFAFIFYLVLACFSLRSFIFTGRFWGEEGDFYISLYGKNILDVCSHTFNGHLELMTNFVVYLSTLVNLFSAPLVTTLLSFALQSLPILLLILNREVLGLSRNSIILFIVLLLGSPGAAEVAANSVNLHFHFALLTIIILLLPVTKVNNFLLLLSGLSGIPANAITPFFLYVARLERNRERMFQFLILVATTVLQIYLLVTHRADIQDREFLFGPFLVIKIFLNQEVILPFTPHHFADSTWLRTPFVWGVAALFFVWFVYAAFKDRRTRILIIINLFLGYFFSITEHNGSLERLNSLSGCRYFYPVYATLVLILLYWLERYRSILVKLILTILTIVALSRIYHYPLRGPSWENVYKSGVTGNDFAIWPTGWKMDLADDQKLQQ